MALVPDSIVGGDFRVIAPLRDGGMGSVWVAEQKSTGKRRALKVMRPDLVGDRRHCERFIQEAKVGASIDSDHVVEVVAAGIDGDGGLPWLAMELLEGSDLAAAIAERGPLPWAPVVEMVHQLAHALDAAHAAGVVHRDLKPENLFLARSRRSGAAPFDLKVLDFGIAKLAAEARATSASSGVMGTPLFIAPEQTEPGRSATAAIDIWALGLIVYRALTARYFWRAMREEEATITAVLREVLFDPIPDASARAAEEGVERHLPPGFDAWFARCVVREPEQRFARAGDAFAALSALGRVDAPRAAGVAEPLRVPTPTRILDRIHDSPAVSVSRAGDVAVVRWWTTPTAAARRRASRHDRALRRLRRSTTTPSRAPSKPS